MTGAFRLGVFIVATLAILIAGVFLIGNQRFLFQRTYRLQADFPNVSGLNNGADVRVGGIHLGTVKQIRLPDASNGEMTVVMDMASSTKDLIRKDSVAKIKTEGLLGNKFVEVSFGSDKAPKVVDGDTIKGETPEDFAGAAIAAITQTKAAAAAFKDDADALKHNFFLRGFFKRRGYEDASELKKNAIASLPSQRSRKMFAYDSKSLFDKPDSAELKNGNVLDEAGQFLEDHEFRLAVVAVSNGTGDTNKDRILTQARAKVVRGYLTQNFKFDDTRLKIIGLGKSTQAGDSGKAEILIYD
jgi:outer membrane protein OmpA-like peptidoglycan-associated protein